MRTLPPNSRPPAVASRKNAPAFTLPEIMTVMAMFLLLVLALLSGQIFGLKMSRITDVRLSSTDSSRKVLGRIRGDVFSGRTLVVGIGDDRSFRGLSNNAPQIGNALQIYPSTDTNLFVRYFLSTNAALERLTSNSTNIEVLARSITNRMVFQAEDFQGRVQTNNQNSRVIRLNLEFYQWEFPATASGQNGLSDYYRLQTRVTRRLIQ